MTDVPSPPAASNGTGGDYQDQQVIEAIQRRVQSLSARREELETELQTIAGEARRYEKALAALTSEPPQPRGRRPGRQPTPGAVRQYASRVGDERLAEIKAVILDYAKDHDEFRQTDIRAISGHSSSIMTLAFEQLRQEPHNVIRFSRQVRKAGPGGGKWFRLTPSALRSEE